MDSVLKTRLLQSKRDKPVLDINTGFLPNKVTGQTAFSNCYCYKASHNPFFMKYFTKLLSYLGQAAGTGSAGHLTGAMAEVQPCWC